MSLLVGQDECRCRVVIEERTGICPVHLIAPIGKDVLEEIEKRRQAVIRRYVVQNLPGQPAVETIPEEISEYTYQQIQSMKENLGLKTFDDVLRILTKEIAYKKDPVKALESHRPLIITGAPETGKTLLCKRLIQEFEKVFVLDGSDEYKDLHLVHSGELFGEVWKQHDRFRMRPHDNPIFSRFEMDYIFGFLTAKMKEPSSPMADFCVVIEDAVRFSDNQAIRSFISESRKWIRKSIIVSQDPRAYEGFGELLKP